MKKIAMFLILSLVSISCDDRCSKKDSENDIKEIIGYVVDKELIPAHRTSRFVGKVHSSRYYPEKYYIYVANKEGTVKIRVFEEDYKDINTGDYIRIKFKNQYYD